jgi:hypothetical protein
VIAEPLPLPNDRRLIEDILSSDDLARLQQWWLYVTGVRHIYTPNAADVGLARRLGLTA